MNRNDEYDGYDEKAVGAEIGIWEGWNLEIEHVSVGHLGLGFSGSPGGGDGNRR